jgi:hypothetical protein
MFDDPNLPCFKEAHRSRDGKIVGIYRAGNPALVYVCRLDGSQLMADVEGHSVPVKIVTHALKGLVPIVDRRDIPAERIRHLPEDWQPEP